MNNSAITRDDILPMPEYAKVRDQRRRSVTELKRNRRLAVGPDITFYFENRETMLHQIHEMLHVEGGGEAQIEDELRAYNPLIPHGSELVATMMIEIEDARRRAIVLGELGGIESHIVLSFDDTTVAAVPESDVERTTPEGKTSSVHFLRFPFTADQVARFRRPDGRIILEIRHPRYMHMAVMPEAVRTALAADFG